MSDDPHFSEVKDAMSLYEQCLELSLDWDSTEDIVRGCVEHVSEVKDAEILRLNRAARYAEDGVTALTEKLEANAAEIEQLKAELLKYQQSNRDHWDHLASAAKELKYDSQVREGHLDVIRDQRKEIEWLKRLITELCDALSWYIQPEDNKDDLLQRAREATHGA